MPNIEIHGFIPEIAFEKTTEIFELLKDIPYFEECVVTQINSNVVDCKYEKQPFLRLVSTDNGRLNDIIKELQKLNIDIEVVILQRFIPKKI